MYENNSKNPPASALGVTLIELSLSMMIMLLLGVCVHNLFRSSMENSINERKHETIQLIGMHLIQDLRRDLRLARSAAISGDNDNTLIIVQSDREDPGTTQTVTYENFFDTERNIYSMKRSVSTPPETKLIYNHSGYNDKIEITCGSPNIEPKTPCFSNIQNPDDPESSRGISIDEIRISVPYAKSANGTLKRNSIVDQVFETEPAFTIPPSTFTILSNVIFR